MTNEPLTDIAVRAEHFAAGMPVIYEKNGLFVAEYSDGNIVHYTGQVIPFDKMMSEKQLLDYGFVEYIKPIHELFDKCWWYTSKNGELDKFQVCVRLWDFTKYEGFKRLGFDAEAHFEDVDGISFVVKRPCLECSATDLMNWLNLLFESKFECRYIKG